MLGSVDVMTGIGDVILLISGYVLVSMGGAGAGKVGACTSVSGTSESVGVGAVLSPKAAAVVGRGGPREGGRVGGADDCRDDELDPVLVAGVAYGAAASLASRMTNGEEVTLEWAVRIMFGVPTAAIVEN